MPLIKGIPSKVCKAFFVNYFYVFIFVRRDGAECVANENYRRWRRRFDYVACVRVKRARNLASVSVSIFNITFATSTLISLDLGDYCERFSSKTGSD